MVKVQRLFAKTNLKIPVCALVPDKRQIIKIHKRRRFTMEYKRFGSKIIVRIDKDEEILEKVKELALKENIRLAAVQALGATNSFTVGAYNVAEKKYYANTFSGSFEIVSLTGTINTMNGEFYTHLHMSAGNDKGEVFGGHLNRAVVSATCEMVVDVLDGTVDRAYDPVTGLNLFQFQSDKENV